MILARKIGTILIIFILITSLFSFLIIPNQASAQPEDDEDLSEYINLIFQLLGNTKFEDILDPHPFRYVGVWKSNDTRTIKGNMDFTLYFSSTILNQIEFLDYQDKISVGVYHFKQSTGKPEKIKEKKDLTLNIGGIDKRIQQLPVSIENLDVTMEEGDYLLFGIQVNQTEKPLSKIVERRFETKFIPRLKRWPDLIIRISEFLEKYFGLEEFGNITDILNENNSELIDEELLSILREIIGGEEVGALINVLVSSAFYYGSDTYNSEVKFSSEEGENFTLYFRNEGDYEFELSVTGESSTTSGYFKIANETAPKTDVAYAWPPMILDVENMPADYTSSQDFLNWIVLWSLFTLKAPPGLRENVDILYLKDDFKISKGKPEGETLREKISTRSSSKWISPPIERNKIIKNITAELYIHYPKLLYLRDIEIRASLIDENSNNKVIANDTKSIDRTNLYELINRGPETPTVFNFREFEADEEIFYDHNLSLEITVVKKPLLSLRPVKLLYNSERYPSHIKYVYNETENIKILEFEDKKEVYAGGSAEFNINIESEHADKLNIDIGETNREGNWNFTWNPKSTEVKSDSTTTVTVTVTSNAQDESAYKDKEYITLIFNSTGKTGIDSTTASVYVRKSAVEYDIELIAPKDIKIKHGQNKTFEFIIKNKNTGFLTDSYRFNISSENEIYSTFNHTTEVPVYKNEPENERSVNITISIPAYTDISKDKLTLEITSIQSIYNANKTSWIYKLNVTIITPNIFENIYHFFEKLSEKIGLNDYIGDYGAWLLIGLSAIIIMILVTIVILIIKRKFATLICHERTKEITSYEKAEFEISLKNPYKETLTYDIKLEIDDEINERWDIELERDQITVESKASDVIRFTVKPTDYVKKEDYAEVRVIVKPINKSRKSKLDTTTVIKDSKIDIKISGVIHWPRIFNKGDRVESSFKLFNRGDVSAENLTVVLLLNGKEKSKVENVTIPRGGYADIKIPWIAKKGKNEIEIIVK